MTVETMKNDFAGHSGIMREDDFILGIDISQEQNSAFGGYECIREGVLSLVCDGSPDMTVRKFVDGHRAVVLSDRIKFTVRFLELCGNAALEHLLDYAAQGKSVRFYYERLCDGGFCSGDAAVSIGERKAILGGMELTVVLMV